MNLMINQAFRILEGDAKGDYRVITMNRHSYHLGIIETPTDLITKPGWKNSIEEGDVKILDNTVQVVLFPRNIVSELNRKNEIQLIQFETPHDLRNSLTKKTKKAYTPKKSSLERHEENVKIMRLLLDQAVLTEYVQRDQSLKGILIQTGINNPNVKNSKIRRLTIRLIRFGFCEESLIPNYVNSGGRGRRRYCEGIKSGRKSDDEREAAATGEPMPFEQQGWSAEWETKCQTFIGKLATPHPSVDSVYENVKTYCFSTLVISLDGKEAPVLFPQGTYPTWDQFEKWYRKNITKKTAGRNKTTGSYWEQNSRILPGLNSDGVGGPGYTFAIDSTIADVYIVSSFDPTLIIGKPIVYFLVDVWSTAKIGYYISLRHACWAEAKIALFCSLYDPEKMASLRGLEYTKVFNNRPGLMANLFSDRGELLSQAAAITAFKLLLNQEFSAPFRGDHKGIVEVQFHKLKKEHFLTSGAYDAGRREREIRKSEPNAAILNIQDFNAIVESMMITDLTARHCSYKHLSPAMLLEIENPTPAALWDWGFDNGYGYAKSISDEELIRLCLPQFKATPDKTGIIHFGDTYIDKRNQYDVNTAFNAMHHGLSDVDAWEFPGNIQQIWTSAGLEKGLRVVSQNRHNLDLVSRKEIEIIRRIRKKNDSKFRHVNAQTRSKQFFIRQQIRKNSALRKKIAQQTSQQPKKQNISQNRLDEMQRMSNQPPQLTLNTDIQTAINLSEYLSTHTQDNSLISDFFNQSLSRGNKNE